MKLSHIIVLATGATLALAGCKKAAEAPKTAAGGELLERSVSDDMLPYDTVRSQASLAPPDDGPTLPRTRGPQVVDPDAVPDDAVAQPEEPVAVDAPPAAPAPRGQ
jgi:hypothetical protein